MFSEEIRGYRLFACVLDEATFGPLDEWQPQLPPYKVPRNKLAQLNQVMQLSATAMLQVSRAVASGNLKSARTKLRRVFHRMDAALHQMDRLQQEMDRQERRRR